jgi:hypothetical protein
MSQFKHNVGRREIFFTDHSLDRWWERCRFDKSVGRKEALALLEKRLDDGARWTTEAPAWSRLSLWHRARAEGFIYIDDDSGFVINRNRQEDGSYERVAVTYVTNIEREQAA